MKVLVYGLFQLRVSLRLPAGVFGGVLRHAQARGEEHRASGLLAPVLRVVRAGVRVADGLLHLFQLGVRVRHRKKPDPPPCVNFCS